MTSKRLLALVLVLCLVFSVAMPAAAAQSDDTGATAEQTQQTLKPSDNNRVVSGGDAKGANTLRDNLDGVVSDDSAPAETEKDTMAEMWFAEEVELSTSILKGNLPACVEELQALSATYAARERVSAFVVLESAPLVTYYTSINDVPAGEKEKMTKRQDDMITSIEEEILEGDDLTVISQFTYLTNAIVVETEFENLEKIACMEGVRTVFLSPVFYPCATDAEKMTVSSGQMSDVDDVWNLNDSGYTGTGMIIAILDTGLDLDHPSFAAAPEGAAWDAEDVAAMLENLDLNAEILYGMSVGKILTASDLYYNGKVPFTFNYAMGTTNVSHNDGVGDHGTHVAGISAANAVEGTGVVGMAPDAQIVVMKVFNSATGGANMYDILNALEDCMKLGVDVANMSLGSPAGFSNSGIEVINEVFESITQTDLIVDVAAGNEGTSSYGSLYGTNLQTTDHIDNATISSPSTYANALSIASVNNNYVAAEYFTLADGTRVFYQPSVEYLYEYTTVGFIETFGGQELEYVIVPNLGSPEDFYDENGESIVAGKIAVVRRGELRFDQKCANAEAAGAAAVLIWDNVSENIFNFGMSTSDDDGNFPSIPVALVGLEDGLAMEAAETKVLTVATQSALRLDVTGGQMSIFSCWGVTPDLRLLPDLTGVGGNVYSCYDGGYYGLMSGTSMATPQVAGVTALVLQYLEEKYPNLTASEKRTLVDSLMMSTAIPVVDQSTGLEASPRQQGAGLVNALNAVTAEAYLTVSGSDRPKAELFDSANGTYSFTFTVHNLGDTAKTYALKASLLCEDFITDAAHPGKYFLAEMEHALDSSALSFSQDTVTVAAGGTATVTVTICLTDADKAWIDSYFPNGNYVEGFVYLTSEDAVDLSLPFLGFYGSWYDAPIFDTGYWYEEGFWDLTSEVQANQYFHILWTSLGASNQDFALGLNPYSDILLDENGNILYSPKNNVISPNGDGVLDMITDYYLSLMRNARRIAFTYTDAEGNVVAEDWVDYAPKTMYNTSYGATVPFVYSWYYDGLYNFTDENGNYLPDGTELMLTISGIPDYGVNDMVTDSIQFPVTIDTAAPVLNDRRIEQTSEESGNYLTLTFKEAHPAYVVLMNNTGTQHYSSYSDQDFVDRGNGNYSVKVDVTGLGDSFTVAICDYGCNESYYQLTYTLTENIPEMDTTALYAYQVYNEYIFYYYGWDYIFGWTTIDKATGYAEMISSDAYEYYALTAAEHVGGYIFAVDSGNNLIYMTPGLWNRKMICNLGMNVIDMAFDDTTGTMYLAVKDAASETYGLYTVDLLTGDLTCLHTYNTYYDMPWAMTFVDGKLYACRYYYNGFYQVDLNTYELTTVFTPTTAAGGTVSPDYAQSMTYSEADGLIYWAYYDGSACELITIDPTSWTNTASAMEWDSEYVGVLTLEEDGYVFPESDTVTKLVMDQENLVLALDEIATLTATPLPWNAEAAEITWSSSDESVAMVDGAGNVYGLAEGEAVITAACGALSVSCTVRVVNIGGSIYYYDYFTGDNVWGAWQNLDLKTMEIVDVAYSPIDFIAADYNGHDGMIYGFDEHGQAYKYDPVTGDCWILGNNTGMLVSDMAYDYSTGIMYVTVYDMNNWNSTIYALSMSSGQLVRVGKANDVLLTLACTTDGDMYAITYNGVLCSVKLPKSSSGSVRLTELLQTPVSTVYYGQSMCYEHNYDALVWVNPETTAAYWLDVSADEPYAINLGDPTGTGSIELMGMFSIPEEIPELPYTPVESITTEDMLVLVGVDRAPVVTASPVNATNQSGLTLVSADESVAKIVNGRVVGVSEGVTTVTATLEDNGNVFESSFNVTVKVNTDNIYAYLMADLATMDGYYIMEIPDEDPKNYIPQELIYCNGTYMCLYAEEYVAADGYVYGYGYDPDDWNANFFFLTIDPKTWSVVGSMDMGDGFPFVYDMAFDYTTGTMYAVAGTNTATDLYMVNMEDGTLIESVVTDPMFMSLAVDAEGTIYGMAASVTEYDWDTSTYSYENALLYTFDVENGTYEVYMDTGVTSNMLATMAYDFDTGNIYWAALDSSNNSGLYLIDLEEKTVFDLGTIGAAGSQVTGMMIFADNYPEIPDTLKSLAMRSGVLELRAGETGTLEVFCQPAKVDVDLTWTSADENIATVDDNGVVTGVSAGVTTVTVSSGSGEDALSATATVIVYGADDYFLTYNRSADGFAAISRSNPNDVTALSEDTEQADVMALEWVDGTIYAYDTEGNLFTTSDAEGYVRSYIGNAGVEVPEDYVNTSGFTTYEYHYYFEVRDMAWDAVNNRMLAIGCSSTLVNYSYNSSSSSYAYDYIMELSGGCKLFEVDLETGALKELCIIGGGSPLSAVYMLTVTDVGQAYIYSSYMDYVCKLDTATGEVVNLSTLQNQGAYGSADGDPMAMAYDGDTNSIYMLFTENGAAYYLYKFNVATTALTRIELVGLDMDTFAGLAVVTHIHTFENGICTGCGAEQATYLLGDVNNDGEVDIFDANLVVAYYNGTAELTAEQLLAADVNGDGDGDIFDANLIVSYFNGTITVFPADE